MVKKKKTEKRTHVRRTPFSSTAASGSSQVNCVDDNILFALSARCKNSLRFGGREIPTTAIPQLWSFLKL